MEPNEYDEMLRTLVRIAAHQETINDDLRAMLRNHDAILRNHDAMLARLDTTQARIETLLTRMIRQQDNGRDAS